MKTVSKIFAAIATFFLLVTAASCAKYDDDINDLRSRVSQLESQLTSLKSNISGLQTAVTALQKGGTRYIIESYRNFPYAIRPITNE